MTRFERFREWLLAPLVSKLNEQEIESFRQQNRMRIESAEIKARDDEHGTAIECLAMRLDAIEQGVGRIGEAQSTADTYTRKRYAAIAEMFSSLSDKIADIPKPEPFDGEPICRWIAQLSTDLRAEFAASADYPRLTREALLAWDAVSYAVEKWRRDPQADELRTKEILAWARYALAESGGVATDAELIDLLAIRDNLHKVRVGALRNG